MEQYQHLNAIILRSRDYKEADQLLTVYTREQGKLTVQVRGVKKQNSKLRGGILLFSQAELVVTAGKAFPIVIGASTITSFASLRSDFARMSYAGYAAELLDQVISEGHADEELYLFMLQTLQLLEFIDPWIAVRYLELKVLERQGYVLNVKYCQKCGAKLSGDTHRGVYGGLLCKRCAYEDPNGLTLTQEGRTFLDALSYIPLHRFGWLYVSREGRESVSKYMDLQMQQVLNYPLRTRDFLRQLNM